MRTELLAGIDEALGGGPRRWDDVVVVRNVGPLRTVEPLVGDVISNRGFNALLCAAGGAPHHFLKLRPLHHRPFEREAAVTVAIARHAATRHLVPATQSFVVGPARVLAQAYVKGVSLERVIRRRSRRRDWHPLATGLLEASLPLFDAISEVVVDRGTDTCPAGAGAASLQGDLDLLEACGVNGAAIAQLRAALSSLQLPAVPQHGDFWPRNVLVVDGGWRVLDFESCGDVLLPLYDVLHFLRGCVESAQGTPLHGSEDWLQVVRRSKLLLPSFQRAAGSLGEGQIQGALIAYLTDFAARLIRRGVAPDRLEGRLRELSQLPRVLDSGIVNALLARR